MKTIVALVIGIAVIMAALSGAPMAVESPLAGEATPAKTGIGKSVQVEALNGKGLGPPEGSVELQPQDEIMLAEEDEDVDFDDSIVIKNALRLGTGNAITAAG